MNEKNKEGYRDRTACKGILRATEYERAREQAIEKMMTIIKCTAEAFGFEIQGRIVFKDKKTKRIFR